MVKYILLIAASLSLFACADQPVKTVYQTKEVPVYVVPAPPTVVRPTLVITTLTDAQKADLGELAKAYSISLKQAMQYSCSLENIVNAYAALAAKAPSLIAPIPEPTSTAFSLTVPAVSQILTDLKPTAVLQISNTAKDCTK